MSYWASEAPQFWFSQLVLLSHPSGAQGRAVLYDSIVYQNNTISPSVFPASSPSEEVGGMNTKLFSKVKIFRVWIDDKITENKLSSLFTVHFSP